MSKKHLQNEFIILRAEGLTLAEIAKALKISVKTAERWNTEPAVKEQVERLKKEHYDQLKETFTATQEERVKILSATLKQIEEAILTKGLHEVSISNLLTLKLKYLKELREEENVF